MSHQSITALQGTLEEVPQPNEPTDEVEDTTLDYSESRILEKYRDNLLQYDEPLYISSETRNYSNCHYCRVAGAQPLPTGAPLTFPDSVGLFHLPKRGHEDDRMSADGIEEILLATYPPIYAVDEEGKSMRATVSQAKGTENDVRQLNIALEALLAERHARPEGVCLIRRQLFSQCFDELIRQEIVECPERGVVLMRIRNEIQMTVGVYQSLIYAMECYSSGKLTMFQSNNELSEKLAKLTAEKKTLISSLKFLESKRDSMEKMVTEGSEQRQKKHDEELSFLSTLNTQLKSALDKTTAAPIQKKVA